MKESESRGGGRRRRGQKRLACETLLLSCFCSPYLYRLYNNLMAAESGDSQSLLGDKVSSRAIGADGSNSWFSAGTSAAAGTDGDTLSTPGSTMSR